jgi:hypothetical protein
MAPFAVRGNPRFRDELREEAEARRLLLRRLVLLDAERLFFRDADRLFVRADALRRLPAERFLDDDLERLRDDDFFFDAIRFSLSERIGTANVERWATALLQHEDVI